MRRRTFFNMVTSGAIAASMLALSAPAALSQDVTLKLHQFLPPPAPVPAKILKPWGQRIEDTSGGKIKIEHFDAMALGGRPSELMQQVQDGAVDIVMTLVGYTPGRFPRTEVFELPFMMQNPVSTALAFQQMIEEDFANNEYKDVKILAAWVHGPGVIHTADGITKLEDMQGKKLRGPTRVINDMLSELGATPVGMPLPAIPEALSKGVIDGTVIPWEVTSAIKLTEMVGNHTEFAGDEALYTATFVLAMNKAKYDSLPDDLRAALDAESGAKLAGLAAQVMWDSDAPARKIAQDAGNTIVVLDESEVARWKAAAQPVIERWKADMEEKGIDGQALIDRANALIEEKSNM
ncbi:TRAP transporter substrate-binding protein [Aliiroseovarius sp. PTFE2010]|uniref:TRAP transporter substrate-binding protein n=1 Tax=Aliiroseovarius sp. PTFE2010 TaxID=3417190 RepID=UPI003CEA22F4